MNDRDLGSAAPTDEQILSGVRRHLSDAEPLIQQPAAWQPDRIVGDGRARIVVRSRLGFGGLAPLVLVAAVVVLAVGFGLSSRPWGGNGGPAATGSSVPSVRIVYQLVAATGQQITDADLDTTVTILQNRVASTGVAQATVTKLPPDRVSVQVFGVTDVTAISRLLGVTGSLEFVALPPKIYGTGGTNPTAGSKALPASGDTIDPALPAMFTGAGLDASKILARYDTSMSPPSWVVDFGLKEPAATNFGTWSSAHAGEYFAIVLDGKVVEAPYIQTAIRNGTGTMSGSFTSASAHSLATILQYGQLPFPLREVARTMTPADIPSSAASPVPSGVAAPTGSAVPAGASDPSPTPVPTPIATP
jgi:protein-export membrane protein SecD